MLDGRVGGGAKVEFYASEEGHDEAAILVYAKNALMKECIKGTEQGEDGQGKKMSQVVTRRVTRRVTMVAVNKRYTTVSKNNTT